jgi:predicted RNase H-like HicB family nuclease
MFFPVLIEQPDTGRKPKYRVFIPSLPGCTAEGRTAEEALTNARTAIRDAVRELRKGNRPVPTITELLEPFEDEIGVPGRTFHFVRVPTWRRVRDTETWHFCRNCVNWPDGAGYREEIELPADGVECNECRVLDQRGLCQL